MQKLIDIITHRKRPTNQVITVVDRSGDATIYPYEKFFDDVEKVAGLFQRSEIVKGDVIGFRCHNSYEWLVWDIACLLNEIVMHVFPEDKPKDAAYDVASKYRLRIIIDGCIDQNYCSKGIAGLSFDHKKLKLLDHRKIAEPGVSTYVYSSGTSGLLKGLKIVGDVSARIVTSFTKDFELSGVDKSLIFLPLSNYQQRLIVYASINIGAGIILTDFSQIFHVLKIQKPTFLIAPPLLYEQMLRLYPKRKNNPSSDNELKSGFGGNIRFLITGMAPIKPHIINEYRSSGLNLFEAYGLTECGMVSWNKIGQDKIGSVGKIIDNELVAISDDGEIKVQRHSALSIGYFEYEDDDLVFSDEVINTGDIGYLDDEGYLFLKGRKKDLIISRNGQKYHPQIIESRIYQEQSIKWCFICQINDTDLVLYIKHEVEQSKSATRNLADYCKKLVSEIMPSMRLFEIIYGLEEPNVDNGFLTRNMKINRKKIALYLEELAVRKVKMGSL